MKSGIFTILLAIFFAADAFAVEINTILNTTPPEANTAYSTETGVQNGRLSRNGTASTCGAVKSNPGNAALTGARQFDQFTFVALTSGCLSVTLSNAGESVLFGAAYNSNGLNTSETSQNYLGDMGFSPSSTVPRSFGIDVVAGQVFSIVVHEVNVGGGLERFYTLDLSGPKLIPDFAVNETLDTITPELNPAVLLSATGSQTGRITRTGFASTCDAPKTNPGLGFPTGARRTDLYRFVPASSGCATISISHSGSDQAHPVVYDENGFQAANPSLNYLADSGGSASNNTRVFSFLVQRGVPFDVAIHEVNPGAGVGDAYSLRISNVILLPKVTITSTLDTTDPISNANYAASSGDQTGRLTRNGIAGTCNDPKPNPGLIGHTDLRRFDAYMFTPQTSGCVEVTLKNASFDLFAVAYTSVGFVPADPSTNYLSDPGSSPAPGASSTFSFSVSSGVPFTVVLSAVAGGGGIGQSYTLDVAGVALDITAQNTRFDFDGDGRADISIFRPGPGEWWFLRSSDGQDGAFQFGINTDVSAPADFTGDGIADFTFFRPFTGEWFVLRSDNTGFFSFPFGTAGDIPAPGDFDGDGIDDPTIFRPSTSTWFIQRSTDGQVEFITFGSPTDKPLVGDFDNDGIDDIGVYKPGVAQFWMQRSTAGLIAYQFGAVGDKAFAADFSGDGSDDIGVWRPTTGEWLILRSEDEGFFGFPFGSTGDLPAPGDYDGDGQADATVFRPSDTTWYSLQSTAGTVFTPFGAAGDRPVPGSYVVE